jgi:hypothetical protein
MPRDIRLAFASVDGRIGGLIGALLGAIQIEHGRTSRKLDSPRSAVLLTLARLHR